MNTQHEYEKCKIEQSNIYESQEFLQKRIEQIRIEHVKNSKYKIDDIFGYRKENLRIVYFKIISYTSCIDMKLNLTINYKLHQCKKNGSYSKYTTRHARINEIQIEYISQSHLIWVCDDVNTIPHKITNDTRNIKSRHMNMGNYYFKISL